MKNAAKIRLSGVEQQLLMQRDWILTKNEVMRKVREMLEQMALLQQAFAASQMPEVMQPYLDVPPKVSRGENYRGLPWLVLDYPRYFREADMLTIRTMFWWGEQVSITLLAAGEPARKLKPSLKTAYTQFREHDYAYCIHATPWEHHFEADNYIPFRELSEPDYHQRLAEAAFFKAGKKFPLDNFEELPEMLETEYRRLTGILKA
jgi:hypothetical protein